MNKHDYKKKYYEIKARNILNKYFSKDFNSHCLQLNDKPDLLDNEREFGVEVVGAYYKNIEQIFNIYNKCKNKNFMSNKDEIYLKNNQSEMIFIDNDIAGCMYKAHENEDEIIMKCIFNKFMKLKSNIYQKVEKYYLYIHMNGNSKLDLIKLKEYALSLCNNKLKYHNIYIELINSIYKISLSDEIIDKIYLNEEEYIDIYMKSKNEAEQ